MPTVRLDAQPIRAFRPFSVLAHPHVQTLLAAKVRLELAPPSMTRCVKLPDGDMIALEVSTPAGWQPDDPTVIMLHGLCGCHQSPYMRRMARKLWRRGIRAVRMNMRGCGSGQGLARYPYHSGRSEDLLAVLRALHQDTPRSPTTLLGFSLGGNIVLKLAGELQAAAQVYCQRVIAVCPPADLVACMCRLAQPSNRLYNRYFTRLLTAHIHDRHARFTDLPPVELPDGLLLYDLDKRYTAPQCGFRDAIDYYEQCSAAPLVPRIAVPCVILFAVDDPFIDATVFNDVALPAHIQVVCTPYGGHLGFLGAPWGPGGYRVLDAQLLAWVGAPRPHPYRGTYSYEPNTPGLSGCPPSSAT